MEKRQRFFIYNRKEMILLLLLAMVIGTFAFTLGVHLGKQVGAQTAKNELAEVRPTPTAPDQLPNRQEFAEQHKAVEAAADESLNRILHDEVARTGVKLEVKRQVELPSETKSGNAGATTEVRQSKKAAAADAVDPTEATRPSETGSRLQEAVLKAAFDRPAPEGRFTIQVGSHPSQKEAEAQLLSLTSHGVQPFVRAADLEGRGRWYRVYVGGFRSQDEAERTGRAYRKQQVIRSFFVAQMPTT